MSTATRIVRRLALPALPVALAAPAVKAQIVYSGAINLTSGSHIYFTFDYTGVQSPAASTSYINARPDFDIFNAYFIGSHAHGGQTPEFSVDGSGHVIALAGGTDIASSGTFTSSQADFSTLFAADQTAFFGIAINDGSGNNYYGWAQITYHPGGASSITLIDFAYQSTANTTIIAGDTGIAIPEPVTAPIVAAVLAGSVALYLRRREKRVAT